MKLKVLTGALMLWIGSLYAQTTQVVDLTTGMNSGTPTAVGSPDTKWTVQLPSGGGYVNALVSNNTNASAIPIATASCGNWISPYLNSSGTLYFPTPQSVGVGLYQYKMTFTSTKCPITSVTLNLNKAAADNTMLSISINGNVYSLPATPPISYASTSTVSMSIPLGSIISGGLNTIIVTVKNESYYTGMLICGDLTINYAGPALTPSISGSSSFCSGSPIVLTGSSGPNAADSYSWAIAECDAAGNPVSAGYTWSNSAYLGSPSEFSLPNEVPCGRYYKITLTVASRCTSPIQTTKIIYIGCTPQLSVYDGHQNICNSSRRTRDALTVPTVTSTSSGGYTLNVVQGPDASGTLVGTIYNGPAINPVPLPTTPTGTTTYICTYTDNTSGCSVTTYVTLYVQDNNPDFNVVSSTTSMGYYTITATPVIPSATAMAYPGFSYTWIVEEIVSPMNTTVISGSQATYGGGVMYSSCWGYTTDFFAYDGPSFTATGANPMAGVCSSPAQGHFTNGHTYRITRGTSSTTCPWSQKSWIVYMAPSITGGSSMQSREDDNAPDYSYLAQSSTTSIDEQTPSTDFSIYPNPSNGLFTIEMNTADKATVEVYDVLGKKVKSFEQSTTKYTLDLTNYPKGMYMINIISKGIKTSKKIVVE